MNGLSLTLGSASNVTPSTQPWTPSWYWKINCFPIHGGSLSRLIVVDLPDRILCSIQLHILCASTGEYHPLASVPVISYPVDKLDTCFVVAIGSKVYFSFTQDNIIVWDWKTGELVFVRLVSTSKSHTSSPGGYPEIQSDA